MIDRFECRGKALQAIGYLLSLPRATLRLPPVTYICKQMCIAFQASLSNPIYVTSLSSLYMLYSKIPFTKFLNIKIY